MKIQLTAKETRKLTAGIGILDATLAKYPTPGWVLKNNINLSSKLIVNEDGSSEIEIHEKSFSTFLESGSDAVLKLAQLAKSTFEKFTEIAKEFNNDMDDAEKSIANRGTGFTESEVGFIIVQGINIPVAAVPYPVRLKAARQAVEEGVMDSSKAAETFQVKEDEIVLPA